MGKHKIKRIIYLLITILFFDSCSVSRESALEQLGQLQEKYGRTKGCMTFDQPLSHIKKKEFKELYNKIEFALATSMDYSVVDLNNKDSLTNTVVYFYNKNKINYILNHNLKKNNMVFITDTLEVKRFKEMHHLE